MGEVWLARDLQLERMVALKLLPPDIARDTTRHSRFAREARAASALSHPNVCTIFALGEAEPGRPFLAMEYVDGQTLRRRMASGVVSTRETVKIGIAVASALAAAHSQGIVHRDIKPENVMIRSDGLVKVLDFGLAKLIAPSDRYDQRSTEGSAVTHPGGIVGTVVYMSPEQARGERVDHRSDLWSLAVVLYEMLTGQLPFKASTTTDVLVAILERDPPPLARFQPDTPPELQRILTKALRKAPEDRYQTARDLVLDLQALDDTLRPSSGETSPRSLERAPGKWPPKRIALVSVIGAALAIVVALVLLRPAPAPLIPPSQAKDAAPKPRRLWRLTVGGSLQTDATWSPDGRFIAYTSDRSGNFDIWVQLVSGGDPVQVTHDPASDVQPDWSPDGTKLVFRSERDGGGLFVVPALGGAERRLTSSGQYPRWSPDGTRILFQPGQMVPGLASSHLLMVGLDGAPPREFWPDFSFVNAASWHPDGRISVLGVHKTLGPGLFTGRPDSNTLVRSAMDREIAQQLSDFGLLAAGDFRWGPGGTTLYLEVTDRGIQNLWRATVDQQTLRISAVERLTTGPTRDSRLALAPSGSRLAFTPSTESVRLWSVPFDAKTGRLKGDPVAITDEGVQIGESNVSPDGTKLLFEVRRAGQQARELWAADLVNGTSRPLYGDTQFRGAPHWSPDNRRAIYLRAPEPPRDGSIPAMEAVVGGPGLDERTIMRFKPSATMQPGFIAFDWSHDGRFLLGSELTNGTYSTVALRSVDDYAAGKEGRTELFHDARYNFWQMRYSPDGRWLSFVYVPVNGQGYPRAAIAPATSPDPSHWRRLADGFGFVDKPRWSPDGRKVYVLARDARARFNVLAITIDPATGAPVGQPLQVTRFDRPDLLISPDVDQAEMNVSADRLILTMKRATGSIWMLDGL
jgi:serine/threonine protein kinase/Tol biopolymer transport system component